MERLGDFIAGTYIDRLVSRIIISNIINQADTKQSDNIQSIPSLNGCPISISKFKPLDRINDICILLKGRDIWK